MAGRFLRENSQLITSGIISSYFGFNFFYKSYFEGVWAEEKLLFKSKANTYIGISQSESEFLEKFLFRLDNSSPKVRFFRAATSIDYVSFGFNSTAQGAHVGLPAVFFATKANSLENFIPPSGFLDPNFTHTLSPITQGKLADLDASLRLWSEEARLFGLARALAHTDHLFLSISNLLLDLVGLVSAYWYAFAITRMKKMQPMWRRAVYARCTVLALIWCGFMRWLTHNMVDDADDKQACTMGLDCAEGGVEFYERLLERNRLMRNFLGSEGEKLWDEEGNYKMREFSVFGFSFLVPFVGKKLTERREFCRRELAVVLSSMLTEQKNRPSKAKDDIKQNKQAKDDKEWPIFKSLRLKLEGSIYKSSEK